MRDANASSNSEGCPGGCTTERVNHLGQGVNQSCCQALRCLWTSDSHGPSPRNPGLTLHASSGSVNQRPEFTITTRISDVKPISADTQTWARTRTRVHTHSRLRIPEFAVARADVVFNRLGLPTFTSSFSLATSSLRSSRSLLMESKNSFCLSKACACSRAEGERRSHR